MYGHESIDGQSPRAPAPRDQEKMLKLAVIDDDPDICVIIRTLFRSRGVEVVEAFTGMRGLSLVRKERPDVVLLDIMMPDIDGYEVYRRIKLDPETKEIPVIFMSALARVDHIQKGLRMGANGYIVKPFSPLALIEKVLAVAQRQDAPEAAVIRSAA